MIADLPNDKLTLIDSVTQHYVTIPRSQYAEQLAGSVLKLPASIQGLLASIKLTVDSKFNMHFSQAPAKGDISTLPAGGHFYFALTNESQMIALAQPLG